MKIYTHMNVDLDAVCSVWAARRFRVLPHADEAEIVFVPANWPGPVPFGDLAVDVSAGGAGRKGEMESDGVVHSCFEGLVKRHASRDDQEAIRELVAFVDAQDAHGSAVRHLVPGASRASQSVLAFTGINAVLRALQSVHGGDDDAVIDAMFPILDGMLKTGRSRQRARLEAMDAERVGPVAIVVGAREYGTNAALFEDHGVRAIVYVDGFNLGVVREGAETIRADHEVIRELVAAAGEEKEWFAHSAGFLYCRGSRKSPATTASKVDQRALARAVAHVFA